MRLASKKHKLEAINNEAAGSIGEDEGVALFPVEPEDMWHLNNLVAIDDVVKAAAIRKVVKTSATGSTSSEKVRTDLTIRVTKTFFDPAASSLHVSGVVVHQNAHVNLGQYHTLDLELNRPFTIWKKGGWDAIAMQQLREALNDDKNDALIAVIMQEGLANICLITDFQTIIKQRVEHNIPVAKASTKAFDGGMSRFYDKTLTSLMQVADFSAPRPLLLASPGYVAQKFRTHIQDQGVRTSDKKLQRIGKDAVVVHASTGYVHTLDEILKSPQVKAQLRDKRFMAETRLMDQFHERIHRDDGRAWYGVRPVEKAVADGAVGRGGGLLLINNSFFRSLDIATRKTYVALVEKVKADGGDARVLSSDHESGQRLDNLGGIAAMLTYPMYDLDESDEEDSGTAGDGETLEGG